MSAQADTRADLRVADVTFCWSSSLICMQRHRALPPAEAASSRRTNILLSFHLKRAIASLEPATEEPHRRPTEGDFSCDQSFRQ
ncbi:hypothetical protein V2G26_005487 [Clonostachys chloroleuca]